MLSGTPESLVSQLSDSESWAGNRIVICSDYALSFPDGLLTPSEMDEVEDMYLEDRDLEMEYDDDDPAPTLYAFAQEWYKAVSVKIPNPTSGSEGVRYLRNLDKKQYVRSDAVAGECPGEVKEKGAESGLGHVVVIMACLTDEEEEIGGEKFGDGSWAGDRLEITGSSGERGWRDVSEQVVERLRRIWGKVEVALEADH